MKHTGFLIVLISILLITHTACTNSTPSKEFPHNFTLSHSVKNPAINALYPSGFFVLDSTLIVLSPKIFRSGFGKLISLKTFQEIGQFGSIGKGPNEIIYCFPLPYKGDGNDSSFMSYDLPQRSVISFTFQRSTSDSLTMRADNKLHVDQGNIEMQDNVRLCRLGEDHYMGLCFHNGDHFFSLLDKDFNQIGYFGNSPVPEQITNAPDRLQGYLAASYGISVYTPFELPYIACYAMQNGVPVKLWEDTFSEIHYQVNGKVLLYKKDKTKGHIHDLQIGEKYIYILWYDNLLSQYYNRPDNSSPPGANVVLVYDHKGQRVAKIRLDTDICRFDISADEHTLYALTTPDYALVTFELPKNYPEHN